jgi:hypothetical protein
MKKPQGCPCVVFSQCSDGSQRRIKAIWIKDSLTTVCTTANRFGVWRCRKQCVVGREHHLEPRQILQDIFMAKSTLVPFSFVRLRALSLCIPTSDGFLCSGLALLLEETNSFLFTNKSTRVSDSIILPENWLDSGHMIRDRFLTGRNFSVSITTSRLTQGLTHFLTERLLGYVTRKYIKQ